VKRDQPDFLADNPFYTKRFAHYVGRRCWQATIKVIAQELNLDWDTVKTLEMQYIRAQLAKAGTPGPKVIGIDEISIRKGHTYRIVVSDLIRHRPLWFGGEDRSEASTAQFYDWLGKKKSARIRLAVMDMWKPFRNAAVAHAPQAAILFDKFHVMRHLGETLDKCERANTRGSVAAIAASSRVRNTHCSRTARISSELPVEQSTQFLLTVNTKVAKALGMTIPESILLRADEVIR
jgi:transposase